jgi:hypothetical protein
LSKILTLAFIFNPCKRRQILFGLMASTKTNFMHHGAPCILIRLQSIYIFVSFLRPQTLPPSFQLTSFFPDLQSYGYPGINKMVAGGRVQQPEIASIESQIQSQGRLSSSPTMATKT